MGLFDPEQQKVVVRVVYDGPAGAGKTTNLRQICQFFTPLRRGELLTPGEKAGRTLFFDWLDLNSGLVAGYALRCQILTVPGQAVLGHRRRRILDTADVVVFVCESSTEGVAEARRMLERTPRTEGVTLIVQANKQDLPGALGPEEVRAGLGLRQQVSVTTATAHRGAGVRETLVLAVRAAADVMQIALIEKGVAAVSGDSENSDALLKALAEEEQESGPSAAGRILSQIGATRGGGGAPGPTTPEASSVDSGGGDARLAPTPLVHAPHPSDGLPPLPDPNVPPGFVWPALVGRATLRGLAGQPLSKRDDLVGQQGVSDGSGASDCLILRQGDWCLKTSGRRRYADVDACRGALLTLARRKLQLGPLFTRGTVLCAAVDPRDGAAWLWTVAPWVPTLRGRMAESDRAGNQASLRAALLTYAQVALHAVALAAVNSVLLDVHPSNFGLLDGKVVYLDDDVGNGERLPAIGHQLLRRVDEYAHHAGPVGAYVEALAAGLGAELSAEQIDRAGLRSSLEQTTVRSQLATNARRQLLEALPPVGG